MFEVTLASVSKTSTSLFCKFRTSCYSCIFWSVSLAMMFLSSIAAFARCVIASRTSVSFSVTLLAYLVDPAVAFDSCES